jgi:hypothetical protein
VVDFRKALGGIKDYLTYEGVLQERGYKPVIVFTTVHSYDNTDKRVIVSTLPSDIKIKRDIKTGTPKTEAIAKAFGETHSISTILSPVTDTSGVVTDKQRAFEGCMIDLTVSQGRSPQPYSWANIIFQNPLNVSPSGDQFFGSDFLKYGFPVWIQIGYVNNVGEIVAHPFDTNKRDDLTIVFAGLIDSLNQELTIQSGDRLLVQAADYRWYFENFLLGQGTIDGDVLIIEPKMKLEDAMTLFFKSFLEDGGETAPISIMEAMGFTVLGSVVDAPSCIVYDFVSPEKLPQRPATGLEIGMAMNTTYLTILQRIEDIYQIDINWVPFSLGLTDIVITRRADPVSMVYDKHDEIDSRLDTRVHQAILGGNVRNWSFAIDAAGSVNQVLIKVVDPSSGEPGDSFLMTKGTIDEILFDWKTRELPDTEKAHLSAIQSYDIKSDLITISDKTKLKGVLFPVDSDLNKVFGKQTKAVELIISRGAKKRHSLATELATGDTLPWPKEALELILRRLHFWGAQGSVMLMGNADIREGDLIEVFDIRPKGTTVLGFQRGVPKETLTPFLKRFSELGLSVFENVFYIWKVRHYLGPQGYWSKVYFRKQRDSLGAKKSLMFKTMQKQSKKGEDVI